MFCPIGPALTLSASSGSLSFAGTDKNDRVLFVHYNGQGNLDLTFNGASGALVNFKLFASGETLFRIPVDATDVFATASGAGGAAAASLIVGVDN